MSAHAYTENALVEGATLEILASLGWTTASADGETFGGHGSIGRESAREVVLVARLRTALTRRDP